MNYFESSTSKENYPQRQSPAYYKPVPIDADEFDTDELDEKMKGFFDMVDFKIEYSNIDIKPKQLIIGKTIKCNSAEHHVWTCTLIDEHSNRHKFVFKLKKRNNEIYFMSRNHVSQMDENFRITQDAINDYEHNYRTSLNLKVNDYIVVSTKFGETTAYAWFERYLDGFEKFLIDWQDDVPLSVRLSATNMPNIKELQRFMFEVMKIPPIVDTQGAYDAKVCQCCCLLCITHYSVISSPSATSRQQKAYQQNSVSMKSCALTRSCFSTACHQIKCRFL